ncbi:MAG: response regulator transcription factor [Sandaracinus sp.]|nr:response regulator transcription factor [Sandaracinus sp.]
MLQLIAKGLSSKEAAEQLQISPTTVDTYRRRIATKLGSRSRAALVRYALAHGMLD